MLNPFFPGLVQRVGVSSPAPVGQSGGWSVQVLLPPDAVQRLGADPSRLLDTRPLAGVDRSRQRTEGAERLIPLRSQTRPGQSCPGQRQQPHRQGGDESKQHGIPEITIIRLHLRSGRRPSPCPRPAAGATERLQCALPCCGAAAQPRQPPPLPSLAPAGHPSATAGRSLLPRVPPGLVPDHATAGRAAFAGFSPPTRFPPTPALAELCPAPAPQPLFPAASPDPGRSAPSPRAGWTCRTPPWAHFVLRGMARIGNGAISNMA